MICKPKPKRDGDLYQGGRLLGRCCRIGFVVEFRVGCQPARGLLGLGAVLLGGGCWVLAGLDTGSGQCHNLQSTDYRACLAAAACWAEAGNRHIRRWSAPSRQRWWWWWWSGPQAQLCRQCHGLHSQPEATHERVVRTRLNIERGCA